MTNFASAIAAHQDLPEDAQKRAGQAIAGAMDPKHQAFLDLLLQLLKDKKIDPAQPKTFLNAAVYEKLTEQQQDQIDLALINLGSELERVLQFRLSSQTPDASPHLQTMIEHLWQIKARIEDQVGDVFQF